MRVGTVRLRHPLDVLLLLDGAATSGSGVDELAGHALDGRPLGTGVTGGDEPTEGEGLGAARQHLDVVERRLLG